MIVRAANSSAARSVSANAHILLIRFKSIGDILFTLPAVHRVREAFPEARISFLVSKEYAPLLAGFRDVDAVIGLDRARFRHPNPGVIIAEALALLRHLRRPKFSLTIDFQGYGETAWLTWWSGARQRWGTVYRATRKWAYTIGVKRDPGLHPATGFLSLLDACGLPAAPIRNQFTLPASAEEEARQFFQDRGLDPARPTLFVQPFTSSPHKDWPLEKYLVLAKHWRAAGMKVIFGGGPADHAGLEPVRQGGFVTSAGLSLLATAGLMESSTLVVGGVTGLLHLAVAMQKRVVMLIGYSTNETGFPYQHPDWAVTAGDSSPAASISVETVIEATAQALVELGAFPSAAPP
jgi:ADP-heptose:LPS heptosyltransferase